jgi:outer membrane lipoprotein-sorting protein
MLMVAALAYIMVACATVPGGPSLGSAPGADQVLERLEARRQAVRSFVMQGELVGQNRRGELTGEHLILGRFPDRLRAEVRGPFDKPALLLVSDGVRLTVLAYGENKAYVGPASRANLSRFLGLALSPAEVYALLTGSVPLAGQIREVREHGRVMLSSEPGKALLRFNQRDGAEDGLIFSLGDYAVNEAWLGQGAGTPGILICRYNAFVSLPEGRYPRLVELSNIEGRSLSISSDRLTINQVADDKTFEITLPPGLEVQRLD